jgi:hypothetical protein
VQTATQLTLCKGKANYAVWIQIYADFFGILPFPDWVAFAWMILPKGAENRADSVIGQPEREWR